MIEILILYIISRREKTIYSIRKEIIEIFGAFTKPSIGTIYPALQRLLKVKAVELNERMSHGGKKSSYYSITNKGIEYFRELFLNSSSENPSVFYTHLQARLGTIGMLKPQDRKLFINEYLKKIEIYKFELEEKLKDEYIELDYYQRRLFGKMLNEIAGLQDYIKYLKID